MDRCVSQHIGCQLWHDLRSCAGPIRWTDSWIYDYSGGRCRRRAEILPSGHDYCSSEDVVQIFEAAYDDMQWVVLEWLAVVNYLNAYEAYNGTSLDTHAHVAGYAHRAHLFYNRVSSSYDTSLCEGGVTWNPALATYKNAITNELFISSSIAMYLYWPGSNDTDPYPTSDYAPTNNLTFPPLPNRQPHDPEFLDNAKKEWDWFKSHNFTNAEGLVVDGFHISNGSTSCDERNEMVYSYNQGVLLSGLRGLWEATGHVSYLDEGYGFIDAVVAATGWNSGRYASNTWAGLGRAGILEDYCDAPANCSQDNLMFKGIYFHHLDLFCKPLPVEKALVPEISVTASQPLAEQHANKCQQYLPWIQHNAKAALATKDQDGIMLNWWGSSYVNNTVRVSLIPLPVGSYDYRNNPAIVSQPLFSKQPTTRRDTSLHQRHDDVPASNVGTVETQAGGVSVLKAAADISLNL